MLVDANQGVQAQTVSNFFMAFGLDLAVVPVINKIDLPGADPDSVKEQMLTLFEIDPDIVILASAKKAYFSSPTKYCLQTVLKNVGCSVKQFLISKAS